MLGIVSVIIYFIFNYYGKFLGLNKTRILTTFLYVQRNKFALVCNYNIFLLYELYDQTTLITSKISNNIDIIQCDMF